MQHSIVQQMLTQIYFYIGDMIRLEKDFEFCIHVIEKNLRIESLPRRLNKRRTNE